MPRSQSVERDCARVKTEGESANLNLITFLTARQANLMAVIKSATTTSIHELFSHEKNICYLIPKYQREYSWNKDHWTALFNDLMGEDALAGHFLGTIIGIDKTQAIVDRHYLEVVDGQQRLTTVTLLLIAIYSQLLERKNEITDEDRLSDISNLRRMLVTIDPLGPRVQLQNQNFNSDDFKDVLHDGGTGIGELKRKNSGHRKIKKAYKFFKVCLESRMAEASTSEVETLLDVLSRTKKATIVSLEVFSHADAFVLFESLNNRGLALTPIDLIKNSLLEKADRTPEIGIDVAYSLWTKWLDNLGDEYRDQERFFRQFYNAFKKQWNLSITNIPVATRSKLISVFEEMLKGDFNIFADHMNVGTAAYKIIIGIESDNQNSTELEKVLFDLSRVEGAPSYILMLSLIVNRNDYGLDDKELGKIAQLLISFFVRRNLTNSPPTYALDRLFISIVESLVANPSLPILQTIRQQLLAVSVSDAVFLERLKGPVYEENPGITRFILIQLAQKHMTNEKWMDLWAYLQSEKSEKQFRWTIEHIVPQGENMPPVWIAMLGGQSEAERVLEDEIHKLGNLTITGYNSTLGNRAFEEKRDRKDNKIPHSYVGYKNGLELNDDLKNAEKWTGTNITSRTDKLAREALQMFKLI